MHAGHIHGTAGMRRSSEDEMQRQQGIRGAKELRGMGEGREKHQDRGHVDLGVAQELGRVHVVPMSEFVG